MKSVIKAVKKLKLWSKKRRKRKRHEHEHEAYYPPPPPLPPPPPPCRCHHCYSCSSSTQPSAPPLPASSWLEAEHNYGTFLAPPEEAYASQGQAQPQETATDSSPVYPTLAATISTDSSSSPSYHQYMVSVSEPVYGIPVPLIQAARRERSSRQYGCVFSFGAYLFRCLCPCFHSREVV